MKMTITIPDQLSERINDYNKATGVPKSTLVQIAVDQYLNTQKMMQSLPDMMMEMKKLMEENKNATDQ